MFCLIPWHRQRQVWGSLAGDIPRRERSSEDLLLEGRALVGAGERDLQHGPTAAREHSWLHCCWHDQPQLLYTAVADHVLSPEWLSVWLSQSPYCSHACWASTPGPLSCLWLSAPTHGDLRHARQMRHSPPWHQIQKHPGQKQWHMLHCWPGFSCHALAAHQQDQHGLQSQSGHQTLHGPRASGGVAQPRLLRCFPPCGCLRLRAGHVGNSP